MAGQNITSGTTTANTVATETFSRWYNSIEIANSGSVTMWARVDGVDPTVAGDDCHFIPASSWISVTNRLPQSGGTTSIKMISSTSTTYTVSGGV